MVGERGCGKTTLALRWCYGNVARAETQELMEGNEILHRKFYRPALRQSPSWMRYLELQMAMRGEPASVELRRSETVVEDEAENSWGKDALDVQVLEGADFEQADYSELAALQTLQTDGFMLCLDLGNARSLENLRLIYERVWKLRGDEVPVVLCALKADLPEEEQEIYPAQIAEFCDELRLDMDTMYFEVSAVEEFGMNESFYALLRGIESHKRTLRHESKRALSRTVSGTPRSVTSTTLVADSTDTDEHLEPELDSTHASTVPTEVLVSAAGSPIEEKKSCATGYPPLSPLNTAHYCVSNDPEPEQVPEHGEKKPSKIPSRPKNPSRSITELKEKPSRSKKTSSHCCVIC